METVTPTLIKELRERTGSGMSDCKKALVECQVDIEKAIEYLRKKGLAKAAKKTSRIATEGVVTSYVHPGNRVAVLLEVNCETDFVAQGDAFQTFVREVALQIAAMNPQYLNKEDIPKPIFDKEYNLYFEQQKKSNKPEHIITKITDGQMDKWIQDICLFHQIWVKDGNKTIFQLQQDLVSKLGENIQIRRFVRYELGEGLEKKQENFAEEVAQAAKG